MPGWAYVTHFSHGLATSGAPTAPPALRGQIATTNRTTARAARGSQPDRKTDTHWNLIGQRDSKRRMRSTSLHTRHIKLTGTLRLNVFLTIWCRSLKKTNKKKTRITYAHPPLKKAGERFTLLWNEIFRLISTSRLYFCRDHKMALLQMSTVEEAIQALIDLHNYNMGDNHHLRVSFSKSTIWAPRRRVFALAASLADSFRTLGTSLTRNVASVIP